MANKNITKRKAKAAATRPLLVHYTGKERGSLLSQTAFVLAKAGRQGAKVRVSATRIARAHVRYFENHPEAVDELARLVFTEAE